MRRAGITSDLSFKLVSERPRLLTTPLQLRDVEGLRHLTKDIAEDVEAGILTQAEPSNSNQTSQ